MRADETLLAALVEQSPEAMLVVRSGRVVFANTCARRLLALDPESPPEALERWAWAPESEREVLANRHARLMSGSDMDPVLADDILLTATGEEFEVETLTTVAEVGGEPAVVVLARNVAMRTASREAMSASHDRFAEAFRLAPVGMLLLDASGRILDANVTAGRLAGLNPEDAIGRPSLELLHPEDRSLVRSWLDSLVNGGAQAVSGERRIVRSDNQVTWVQISMALLPGSPPTFVGHLIDVTERRETEARLAHAALHDALTGLPNRVLLFDRLSQAVRAALRGGPGVTVLYLDLDHFKTINDTHGHATGDRILRVAADRLARVLRPADTVARLGGDEFAIVAEGLPVEAANDLAARVAHALAEPVPLGPDETPLPISMSIGIAHSSLVPLDVDALLTAADADMYRVKQQTQRSRPGA
ncbi:MAG TPA: diguanylate cyclase [Frankiaceae bacterium]|nr:diguanylate cyclase [Frankiaceae bacterium]